MLEVQEQQSALLPNALTSNAQDWGSAKQIIFSDYSYNLSLE